MTANELSDELERHCIGRVGFEYLDQAATMLRHQQAEIEVLKQDNKELHAIAQRMAMAESDARKSLQNFKDYSEKLTDKEILEEWDWNSGEILATDLLDFADAILRKAQEKCI